MVYNNFINVMMSAHNTFPTLDYPLNCGPFYRVSCNFMRNYKWDKHKRRIGTEFFQRADGW